MNVLLSGGAGFVGLHIAAELLSSGSSVVIADNFSNSSLALPQRLFEISGSYPAVINVDITDFVAINNVFSSHSFDAVVHLAGFKAVGESMHLPLKYYRNNLICAINIIESMSRHNVKRLVFSSSAAVYGNSDSLPFKEDLIPSRCASPYGYSKLMIEQIIEDTAASDPSLSAVLLRYFNPVGAHESGLIGEFPIGPPNNLMPHITRTAKKITPVLHVFGGNYHTRDGTCVRDYVHVIDLAKGHIKALEYTQKHTGTEIFNLGTGGGYSVLELIETFERVNNVHVPYEIVPNRPGDAASCYADVTKAARILGWRAEKTLADMCRDAWRWAQSSDTLLCDSK